MNFNTTSSILIALSILTIGALYFIGLVTPEQHEIIKFGYDTSYLVLIIGYILRKKNIQQLIGLLFYVVVYNFDILKGDLFQISNNTILYFARQNSLYVLVIAVVFLFPTLFEKYKLAPLTNNTNIKDATIILGTIVLTILMQTTIRLMS